MTDNAPPVRRESNDIRKLVPGILISLIALGGLFVVVDWREFGTAIKQANLVYLVLAIPIYLISYITRSRSWQVILLKAAPLKTVFLTEQIGYLLNNLFPFRVGELGRAYLLGRTGLGFWRVFSTILVERAFDMLLAVGLLLGSLPFVVEIPGAQRLTVLVGAIVLVGLVFLFLLARKQAQVLEWFEKMGKHWPRLVAFGREKIRSFLSGLSALADPIRFIEAFSWMALSWLLAIIVYYMVLKAFVPDAKFLWAAFSFGVAALGVAIPSSPGNIGIYEAAFVYGLSFFEVPLPQALAFALTSHGMFYLVTGVLGAYGLSQEGESILDLFQAIRKQPAANH
jgi:glycosyltransferase 2 family protein